MAYTDGQLVELKKNSQVGIILTKPYRHFYSKKMR